MSNQILSHINSPRDLADVPAKNLPLLAAEIREKIIEIVSRNGGHLASNLGVVELTLVLHRVFRSPIDKIIWDVGHQCYAHKLLTGRRDEIGSIRQRDGLSGFPKTAESPHDIVETGHSSTSISSALGILTGQDLLGKTGKVIAVIGDGSLSGGMAFEALNHAGHLAKNLIIVLNDNQMSISPNVGALSGYLSRITATRFYQRIRTRIDVSVKRIPVFGGSLMDLIDRLKKGIKAFFFKETLFSDFGFEYIGPIDGHSLGTLQSVFQNAKALNKPVVVHVVTQKGRGYPLAEIDPTLFHGIGPFSIVDGKIEERSSISFSESFSQALVDLAADDKRITAITAAMAHGTGLSQFQERYPERFFDVGITEQHAVTFAAGLAISGMRPVVALYSTFLQRSVDQIIHDVALPGLPVLIVVDRAGFVGGDGETHQGIHDIALLQGVKGLTILTPAGETDLREMMRYCLSLPGPSIIRYPKASCYAFDGEDAPITAGRGTFVKEKDGEILLLSTGGMLPITVETANVLLRQGIHADIYHMRFIKPLDETHLRSIISRYSSVVLIEDGVATGGAGEHVAALLRDGGIETRFIYRGIPEEFDARGTRDQLIARCGQDSGSLARMITELQPPRRFYRLHLHRPSGNVDKTPLS